MDSKLQQKIIVTLNQSYASFQLDNVTFVISKLPQNFDFIRCFYLLGEVPTLNQNVINGMPMGFNLLPQSWILNRI